MLFNFCFKGKDLFPVLKHQGLCLLFLFVSQVEELHRAHSLVLHHRTHAAHHPSAVHPPHSPWTRLLLSGLGKKLPRNHDSAQ